jgi:transcription elongation factor S-II
MVYWDTLDQIRPGAVNKLGEIVGMPGGDLPRALEVSIYNHSIREARRKRIPLNWENPDFRKCYSSKLRSICFNISNPRNPRLLEGLLEGQYTTAELVEMSPMQMFPELWESAIKAVENKTADPGQSEGTISGMFQCGRCKGRRTTYYQLQTRSADEPMTTFVLCMDCGKRWKF